jgi:hypothetical protein
MRLDNNAGNLLLSGGLFNASTPADFKRDAISVLDKVSRCAVPSCVGCSRHCSVMLCVSLDVVVGSWANRCGRKINTREMVFARLT